MKYKVRKAEQVTFWYATQPIELDPEDFKNLEEEPYTGDSEEAFVKYISDLDRYNLPYDLDGRVVELIEALHESPMEEVGNSAQKSENSWFELGEQDESYRKTGGFYIQASSND
jgi:hypothetical protein